MPANRYAFFRGELVPIEQAKVSIMTHTFNYGTGCFEGIRAYWNATDRQLNVFRLKEHYDRFLSNCRLLYIQLPYSSDDLCQITLDLLRHEHFEQDTYIRPLGYKADELIGVRLHNLENQFALFALPFGRYIENEEGSRVTISSWRRVDDNAIPARGKVIGSYVNSALAKTDAQLKGFDEAIVLTNDGHVSEGSAENIFLVRNGQLITPGVVDNILEGVTRTTIMELALNELDMACVERPVDRTELYAADELFLVGTGVQVAAIIEVDHRPVGTGKIGPVVSRLRDLYFAVARGENPKYRHWCTPVYE